MWFRDPRGLGISFPGISLRAKMLVFAFTVPYLAWKVGVYQRISFSEKCRNKFSGSTAFYGKRWGNENDYAIECSLKTGDILFCNYDIGALHPLAAIKKTILNRLEGRDWDKVGLIERTNAGVRVHFSNCTMIYADVLADYRVSNVGIRRLLPDVRFLDIRDRLASVLANIEKKEASLFNTLWQRMHESEQLVSNLFNRLSAEIDNDTCRRVISETQDLLHMNLPDAHRERATELLSQHILQCKDQLSQPLSVLTPTDWKSDSGYVLTVLADSDLIPKGFEGCGMTALEQLHETRDGRYSSFFFPRHGVSDFTNVKTSNYLGSVSYERLNQGRRGSSLF